MSCSTALTRARVAGVMGQARNDPVGPDVWAACRELVPACRVIREVPGAGTVAAAYCGAHDYADPGTPRIAWNDEQARFQLVDALVTDALHLPGRLPEQDLGPAAADAVGILALVPRPGTCTRRTHTSDWAYSGLRPVRRECVPGAVGAVRDFRNTPWAERLRHHRDTRHNP